jgi:hypothetical protein
VVNIASVDRRINAQSSQKEAVLFSCLVRSGSAGRERFAGKMQVDFDGRLIHERPSRIFWLAPMTSLLADSVVMFGNFPTVTRQRDGLDDKFFAFNGERSSICR